MTGFPVTNDELVNAREFRERMSDHLDSLRDGDQNKIVITRHGQMEVVVLSVEEYSKMKGAKR